MAYEVTATRRRPQTFDELVGQEFVVATMRRSLEQQRIAHAYLLAGPRGVGKTSVARILAKSLNCERGPTPSPCGECSSCREIARASALDVIEIDGASNTSVNDVRQIRDEVLFAPNSARHKVYIIDEVHMLSNSAFNALLKTIEEPPPYVVFIFATTEMHKVPATIRSRCQQFNFRLIPPEEIVRMLEAAAQELGIQAEPDALYWIAKESTGSLRDAYTLLDQAASFSGGSVTLKGLREKLGVMDFDTMNELGQGIVRQDAPFVLERTHGILAGGVSVEQFTLDLAEYFRNVLFLKHGIRRRHLLGYPPEQFAEEVVAGLEPAALEKAIELLLELYRHLRYTLNPIFELELVMSRLAALSRLVSPAELSELIAKLRSELRPAGGSRPAPAAAPAGGGAPPRRGAEPGGARAAPQGSPQAVRQAPPAPQSPSPSPSVSPSAASGAPGGASREQWTRIAEACRKEKPLVGTALDKAVGWQVDERSLLVSFRAEDRFQAELVEAEAPLVAAKAAEVLGRSVSVTARTASGEPKRVDKPDERVELVKRIFRGEIVEGGS